MSDDQEVRLAELIGQEKVDEILSKLIKVERREVKIEELAPPEICDACGHSHSPDGCFGFPTESDRWAGVSPAVCDCDRY